MNASLYPMLVFAGLWTVSDRAGRFEWKSKQLKLDILPFLNFDMAQTLAVLATAGLVQAYESGGKHYGVKRGAEAAGRQRVDTRRAIRASWARMAAQGIAVDDGSALSLQEDIAEFGELDALTIQNNAAREAFGYKTQASDYRMQGSMGLQGAKNTAAGLKTASYFTLLTGGAQAYDIYRSRAPNGVRVNDSNSRTYG